DYVEQHHIADTLVLKLTRLIGPPPVQAPPAAPPADSPEDRNIRDAGEERLNPLPAMPPSAQQIERAQRLARLVGAHIALYNGDAIDQSVRNDDTTELEARLRLDLEEGRLLFDLRVPETVRRTRDFMTEALDQLRAHRRGVG